MHTFIRVVTSVVIVLLVAERASSQVKQYPFESTDSLALHNVAAQPVTLQARTVCA